MGSQACNDKPKDKVYNYIRSLGELSRSEASNSMTVNVLNETHSPSLDFSKESDKACGDDKLLTADADKCKSVEDKNQVDNDGSTSSNKDDMKTKTKEELDVKKDKITEFSVKKDTVKVTKDDKIEMDEKDWDKSSEQERYETQKVERFNNSGSEGQDFSFHSSSLTPLKLLLGRTPRVGLSKNYVKKISSLDENPVQHEE